VIDLDRASLDRILPAPAGPADWDEVMERFAAHRDRRRRRRVLLAVAALVVAVGTTSALAVRAYVFHQSVGLAPEGATPSTPKHGELVLGFMFGHNVSDAGRFIVYVYADGRLISQRVGDHSRTDEYRKSTGFLEQRLTPEGVELVRAEVLSTGLVDHDLHLLGGDGLYFGSIDFRTEHGAVKVTWGDVDGRVYGAIATPEEASGLVRLDERLEDPASWLPASAWEDPEIRAYVPSRYSVCLQGKKGLGLSRVLALLPESAGDLLGAQENTRETNTNQAGTFVSWCSELTNDEARVLERRMDDAGVRGLKDEFGLTYGTVDKFGVYGTPDVAYFDATDFSLSFNPILPEQR
jgi:hypothetical protein